VGDVLRAKGELTEARQQYEFALDVHRHLLGERDPATSASALRLFISLREEGQVEAAAQVFAECLAWLRTSEDEALSAAQLQVRAQLDQLIAQDRSKPLPTSS
jgi:hypothetical protein